MSDGLEEFRRRHPQYKDLSAADIARQALTDPQLAHCCYQFIGDMRDLAGRKAAELAYYKSRGF